MYGAGLQFSFLRRCWSVAPDYRDRLTAIFARFFAIFPVIQNAARPLDPPQPRETPVGNWPE
jgi:hypothetical protein